MVAPTLTDYQYQFKDSGQLLNGPATTPFVDVLKVTGLADLPEYDIKEDDIDGASGSFITVRYSKYRLITLEGFIYASPTAVDSFMDTMRGNFLPDNIEYPFYFKGSNISQRYCNCKALGFKADIDTLRRIGSTSFLITLGAQNPHMRQDNANITMTTQATNYAVTNSGNDMTYPTITITGGTASQIVLTNQTTGQSLTLTRSFIGTDVTTVDMRNGLVYVNGIQNSVIATGTFWGIAANSTQNIRWTYTGTVVPTSIVAATYSGWM